VNLNLSKVKQFILDLAEKIHIRQNIYIKNKYLLKKKSYSMHGEDLIIDKYFEGLQKGLYLDLGCYHPLQWNNTMLLYQKGWRGINIDLSEFSIKLFNFCRPDDLNLNLAVSKENGETYFYTQKKLSLLSTIKKSQSDMVFQGNTNKKKISTRTLTEILDNSIYKNKHIDFLDLDVEGSDLEALQSLDFSRYAPKVICVEILDKNIPLEKNQVEQSDIYKFLIKKHYKKKWSGIFNYIFIKD